MAAPATLPALLDSLSNSLASALEATPKLAAVAAPKDGLSLLDVKNDLLLAYLQNLVFLILLKLRSAKDGTPSEEQTDPDLNALVVKKLVELRVYLERGVRPLEDKLRYRIEKILRAADDAQRDAKAAESSKQSNGRQESDEDSDEDESGEDQSDEEEDGNRNGNAKIADLQYRPNLSAFVRPAAATGAGREKDKSGAYRPPKVAPTVMPMTEKRERAERKPLKSATLDEFIADELSTVPVAQPSIGTTITAWGRKVKTASERKKEAERLNYEETNFVRLPSESKKDRAKRAKQAGGSGRMTFGGEDWRDLGEGVDRINRLTKGKESASGTKALLEKSRKRGFETSDGPRGSGSQSIEIGDRYQKRLKVLDGGRKDKGKKKR